MVLAPSRVAQVRKPVPSHELYVVNQDYGYHSGWAVGSLAMAEKVLQAELKVAKPSWLAQSWYDSNILQIQEDEQAPPPSNATINSDFHYLFGLPRA